MIEGKMHRFGWVGVGLAICGLAAGCTAFDPLDMTGQTINRNEADYANDATLLNIIRATELDPLSFVTITGLDGTASVTGSLGLATVTLGPLAATSKRNYAFGPNSIGRANTDTFHVSVVDDPASFAGLMAPVNPAVLAFLVRQGMPQVLLFFLLTSEVREYAGDPESSSTPPGTPYFNNPDNKTEYGKFVGKMASLLYGGLVAEVDATAFPSGKVLPASKLCLDDLAPKPQFGPKFFKFDHDALSISPRLLGVSALNTPTQAIPNGDPATCSIAKWVEADVAVAGAPGGGGGGNSSGSLTALGVTRDGALWATVGPKNRLVRISPEGHVSPVTISSDLLPDSQPKSPAHLSAFEFRDHSGKYYQIFFRSTIGAYYYAGAYYKEGQIDNLLPEDRSKSGSFTNLVEGAGRDCFAEVDYRGKHFCVPDAAENTKRLFIILHLLQQLETSPSNSPTTLTVTPVP